ncbi:hypothetical protein KC19_1G159200 [Ceratodon purpureus]|uniref:Uncharacterized protein n=1 Tax=Ceratodon purpureus TaxID=3225 RepID=A0A8T0J8Q1_CERPU|nr:hypothetical protein KC19_1G158900 [Ceratodon purpureus]KAG0591218.1 hypothetical protein KC19_1G159200 [Ceratodon purpureus]
MRIVKIKSAKGHPLLSRLPITPYTTSNLTKIKVVHKYFHETALQELSQQSVQCIPESKTLSWLYTIMSPSTTIASIDTQVCKKRFLARIINTCEWIHTGRGSKCLQGSSP